MSVEQDNVSVEQGNVSVEQDDVSVEQDMFADCCFSVISLKIQLSVLV